MIDLSDTLYQQESSIRPVIAAGDTVIAGGAYLTSLEDQTFSCTLHYHHDNM